MSLQKNDQFDFLYVCTHLKHFWYYMTGGLGARGSTLPRLCRQPRQRHRRGDTSENEDGQPGQEEDGICSPPPTLIKTWASHPFQLRWGFDEIQLVEPPPPLLSPSSETETSESWAFTD